MPNDIIDNRTAETLLATQLKTKLGVSETAKFAIGFFFLSGFKEIQDQLDNLKEVKLLIGSTTTKDTIEHLAEAHKRLDLVESVTKRAGALTKDEIKQALQKTAGEAQETLSLMEQTDRDEALVNKLIQMIEEKRLLVKVYTKGRLHAKAYILDYADKRDHDPYASLQRAGKNLRGIMESLLYKRLESSVKAFQVTVKDLITVHERFLKALSNGIVAVGEELQKFLYETDIDDEVALVDALQAMPSSKLYKIEDFIGKAADRGRLDEF